MISISNLSVTFSKGTATEVAALRNVSVTIGKGEFVVLLGSNGSGKSTLLNTIAGTVIPDSGTVLIEDNNVTRMPDFERSRWISRIFQDPLSGTAPDLSVVENFRLASLRTGSKKLVNGISRDFRSRVAGQVSQLGIGLESRLDVPVGSLSGGQRQALTLLMASMDYSGVMLLDEPAAALDPRTADQVMTLADRIIREKQITAILVTHNLRDAIRYGTRIILMSEGSIKKDIDKKSAANLDISDLYSWF